jgi:Mn-dependent DtxR family transcriptional regulator
MGILKKNEYIVVDEDGYITLTADGKKIAEQLYERQTLLSKMLMSLGVDEKTATEDACKMEHVISEKTFDAIKQHYIDYKE